MASLLAKELKVHLINLNEADHFFLGSLIGLFAETPGEPPDPIINELIRDLRSGAKVIRYLPGGELELTTAPPEPTELDRRIAALPKG